jgi:two-component system, NtrC family, sensor kinase
MIPSRFKSLRFHTRVLVPVVVVMVLLVVATMYVVNIRLKRQFNEEATQSLQTAEAVFKALQKERAKTFELRRRHVPTAPHYRATFKEGDAKTIQALLDGTRIEIPGELVNFKTNDGTTLATSVRDSSLNVDEFETKSELAVRQALEGTPAVDIIRLNDRLFDVVSLPVTLPGGELIGALTLCEKFGEAEAHKLSELSGCGIVLIANSNVVASSLPRDDVLKQSVRLFNSVAGMPLRTSAREVNEQQIVATEEHFHPRVGTFDSLSKDAKIGYVLLYSDARAMSELRATQRILVSVSVGGIPLATIIVWLLIRNTTRPLRQLRDSAEAVGRGDFSHRVHANSQDECGELANVFNRMTENLQVSRSKLEETVTRLENTQAQLVQSEKLSAIGEFVAGVTHELNNPLTSLLGFSDLLQQTKVDERQKRFIDHIAGSARRCQKIVQSLLSFARQHAPERKFTNVNDMVEAVIEIMAYEMRTSNIEVLMQLDPALPKVLVDSHQVQQVFLNLVNNARQAMEAHQTSGLLRIRTESLYDRVRVTFHDNGPGISEENLKKIFDPFFTTKEAGKGTGLGLSLSYGIIQEHGGTIRAESKPGLGAMFVIELPAHSPKSAHPHKDSGTETVTHAPNGNGKRVLVIDDEEAILDFVSEVLNADGFSVDTARDGEAALKQLRQKQYDLALCDWKMPGLNGQKLYERVRVEDPTTARRFVFMTGDVINDQAESFLKQHRRTCLSKPFSVAEFRNALAGLAPLV